MVAAALTMALAASTGLANDIPRTPDGKPDLQGVWANNRATPMERPEELADKAELSAEEVAELQARADELFNGETDAAFGDAVFSAALAGDEEHESYDPATGNYNHFWVADREFDNRTSLIVDPPNGRLPALTDAATKRMAEFIAYRQAHPADSYTDRSNSDRCISYGVPFLLAGYNGYFQIVQNPDHVVILQEMIHEARIVPVDGTAPLDAAIDQYTGSSRGFWDGDTLVVQTANFSPKSALRTRNGIANENLTLEERYTLVDADTLDWAITVTDESTWVTPWTALVRLDRSADPIFEYACHEGNYAMEGILAGARQKEADAAAAAASEGQE